MVLKNTRIDSFSGSCGTFDEIRFKLELNDDWIVTNVTSFRGPGTGPEGWMRYSLGTTAVGIEPRNDITYRCPGCGNPASLKQMYVRNLHHLRGYGFDTILRVRIPQIRCRMCGIEPRLPFPLARKGVSYTVEFEKWVMRLLLDDTVAETSRKTSVGSWIIWDILFFRVDMVLPRMDLRDVRMITIDETSFRRNHDYVTIVTDQFRRLIFMCRGNSSDAVRQFTVWLAEHNGNADSIEVVCADMSVNYESGVNQFLPNAELVFDKFHVFKMLNDDMNNIRKTAMRQMSVKNRHALSRIRFTVFRHEGEMGDIDLERLEKIRMINPHLALAYDMKEAFFRIYEQSCKEAALEYFHQWHDWVMEEGCRVLRVRAEKLCKKIDRILSWYDHPMTNGFAEGLNSRIQKIRSESCGFTNVDNFIRLCYYKLGGLTMDFSGSDGGALSSSESNGVR